MYYSEFGQRDLYVRDEPENGLRIWGQLTVGGEAASVDLCQVFLEYALACQAVGPTDEAPRRMQVFAESLGSMLAEYLKTSPSLARATDAGACALEAVLESINAHLSVEHFGPELRFVVAGCPLLEVANRTGLTEFELAQYGFIVMCQTLIHGIDSALLLHVPAAEDSPQVFTILKPV